MISSPARLRRPGRPCPGRLAENREQCDEGPRSSGGLVVMRSGRTSAEDQQVFLAQNASICSKDLLLILGEPLPAPFGRLLFKLSVHPVPETNRLTGRPCSPLPRASPPWRMMPRHCENPDHPVQRHRRTNGEQEPGPEGVAGARALAPNLGESDPSHAQAAGFRLGQGHGDTMEQDCIPRRRTGAMGISSRANRAAQRGISRPVSVGAIRLMLRVIV